MAQHKYKPEWEEGMPPLAVAADGAAGAPSPARILQQLLDERSAMYPEVNVERWSQRRALAFIVVSASTLWLAILAAGAQAVHALS